MQGNGDKCEICLEDNVHLCEFSKTDEEKVALIKKLKECVPEVVGVCFNFCSFAERTKALKSI